MQKIMIKGMMCEHCAAAVKKAMEETANSGTVNVDLKGGFAEWSGSADAKSMVQAVTDQGYEAESK